MAKKRHRHYKLVDPAAIVVVEPRHRVLARTVAGWAVGGALAGILAALLLLGSLFTHWRFGPETWLHVWPASLHLLTAQGLTADQMKRLAFEMAGENGLLYAAAGAGIGLIHGLFRILRRRRTRVPTRAR